MLHKVKTNLKKFYVALTEKRAQAFFSSHLRPIWSKDFDRKSHRLDLPSYALVMQGPLCHEYDLTLETIKIYKKNFPEAKIILSTWQGEKAETLNQIQELGVTVIKNQKPAYNGPQNINFQIVSTLAGMQKAKSLGVKYVFKTRTDQRIYESDVFPFMLTLQKQFPVRNSPQKARLITSSLLTFKYRPYSITDTFMFGTLEDMLLYWDVPADSRPYVVPARMSVLEWAEANWGEAYFLSHFLKKIGRPPKMTLADTWQAYGDCFCVIDQQDLDLFWLKYERHREYRHRRYDGNFLDQELSFKDWLLIHNGTLTASEAERVPMTQEFNNKFDL